VLRNGGFTGARAVGSGGEAGRRALRRIIFLWSNGHDGAILQDGTWKQTRLKMTHVDGDLSLCVVKNVFTMLSSRWRDAGQCLSRESFDKKPRRSGLIGIGRHKIGVVKNIPMGIINKGDSNVHISLFFNRHFPFMTAPAASPFCDEMAP
jgi:hypothetical protein